MDDKPLKGKSILRWSGSKLIDCQTMSRPYDPESMIWMQAKKDHLLFNCGIPPAVQQDDFVGHGQVQAQGSCLDAAEQHLHLQSGTGSRHSPKRKLELPVEISIDHAAAPLKPKPGAKL